MLISLFGFIFQKAAFKGIEAEEEPKKINPVTMLHENGNVKAHHLLVLLLRYEF